MPRLKDKVFILCCFRKFMSEISNSKARMVLLGMAQNVFNSAIDGKRKLDVGERIFIYNSVSGALSIPYRDRPEEMDLLIIQFIERGVVDYREKPRGYDKIIDFFYRNPERYHPEVFAGA